MHKNCVRLHQFERPTAQQDAGRQTAETRRLRDFLLQKQISFRNLIA